jgi:bifunctional non-homologous end joining protein LigD
MLFIREKRSYISPFMSPPLRPYIPTRAITPPTGERWVHEVKFDGYRLLVQRVSERVVLRTRGGFDWNGRYPRIVRSMLNLSVSSVTMDGEVAILTEDGVSDFDALHSRTNDARAILLVFDLLEIEGEDLRDQPLVERKRRLRQPLSRRDDGLQYVEFLEGDGATIFANACRLGLEGIVGKRADSPYRAGPSKTLAQGEEPRPPLHCPRKGRHRGGEISTAIETLKEDKALRRRSGRTSRGEPIPARL